MAGRRADHHQQHIDCTTRLTVLLIRPGTAWLHLPARHVVFVLSETSDLSSPLDTEIEMSKLVTSSQEKLRNTTGVKAQSLRGQI